MKKIIIILSALCIVSFFPEYLANTKASEKTQQELPNFTTSSKGKNQLYGYFMLELYHNEIMSAIQEYYNDNNIKGYGTPSRNLIRYLFRLKEIRSTKVWKNIRYVLKITLIPSSSNGKIFGTDTLYFAVEPSSQTTEESS